MHIAKRKVNKYFDDNPSITHKFNYFISKEYIKNKVILDIGCWTGLFENLSYNNAKKIYGIDPGYDAIEYAKKKFPKADFKVGNALNLPYKKNKFDCVLFLEVIEHLPKDTEIKALKEIKKVLKPNGYLILSTPSNNIFSIILDPAYFLIGHRHYSINKLENLLSGAGFSIEKIYITGRFAKLVSSNIELLFKHLFGKKFIYPTWFNQLIENEYHKGGFAKIHLVAKVNKTT